MKVRKIVILVCVILFFIYVCYNMNRIKELFSAELYYKLVNKDGIELRFPLDHISFKHTSINTLSDNAIAFRQINNNLFEKYTSGEDALVDDNYIICGNDQIGYIDINLEGGTATYNLFYNVKFDNNNNNYNKLSISSLNSEGETINENSIKATYMTAGNMLELYKIFNIEEYIYEKIGGQKYIRVRYEGIEGPKDLGNVTQERIDAYTYFKDVNNADYIINNLNGTNITEKIIDVPQNNFNSISVNMNNIINEKNLINSQTGDLFFVDFYVKIKGNSTQTKKLQINLQQNSDECYLKIDDNPIIFISNQNKNEIIYDFKLNNQEEIFSKDDTRITIFMNTKPVNKPNITFTISNVSFNSINTKISDYQEQLKNLNDNLKDSEYVTKSLEKYIKIDRPKDTDKKEIELELNDLTILKEKLFNEVKLNSDPSPTGIVFNSSNQKSITGKYELFDTINLQFLKTISKFEIEKYIKQYQDWEERNINNEKDILSIKDLIDNFDSVLNKDVDIDYTRKELSFYNNITLEDIDNIESELDIYNHQENNFLKKEHPFHITIQLPKFESSNPELNIPKNNTLYTYFLYPQSRTYTNKVFQQTKTFIKNKDYIEKIYKIDLTQEKIKLFLDDTTDLSPDLGVFKTTGISNTNFIQLIRDNLQMLRVNIFRLYELLTNKKYFNFMNQFIKTVSPEGLLGIFNESQKKIYMKVDSYFNQHYNFKLPNNVDFINENYIEFVKRAFKDIEKIGQSNYLKTLIIDFVNYYIYESVNYNSNSIEGKKNIIIYEDNEKTLIQINKLKKDIAELHQNLMKNNDNNINAVYYQKSSSIDNIIIPPNPKLKSKPNPNLESKEDGKYQYLIKLDFDDNTTKYFKKNIPDKKINIKEEQAKKNSKLLNITFKVIKDYGITATKGQVLINVDDSTDKEIYIGEENYEIDKFDWFTEIINNNEFDEFDDSASDGINCKCYIFAIYNNKKYKIKDFDPLSAEILNIEDCNASPNTDGIWNIENFTGVASENTGTRSTDTVTATSAATAATDGSTGAPPDGSTGAPPDGSTGAPPDGSTGAPPDGSTGASAGAPPDTSTGKDGDMESQGPIQSESHNSNSVNEEDKNLMEIINKMMDMYKSLSDKVLGTGTDNSDKMVKDLALFESLTQFYEQQKGSENEHIKFMKQLLMMTNQKLTEILGNLTNTNKSQNQSNYMQKPHLPNISQFKPSGTSNIFSPIIDIKTGSARNNERMAESIRKGYSDFNQESRNINPVSIDGRVQNTETQINQDIDQNILQTVDQSFETNKVFNPSQNINLKNTKNKSEEGYMNTKQGIRRGTNEPLGIPGYTYIDPNLWDIPKKRNPVCINQNTMKQGEDAINPAGYLGSGVSNVMEFQGVGSILPKFKYQEDLEHVSDCNKKY